MKKPKKVIPVYLEPTPCRKCGRRLNAHAGDDPPTFEPGDINVSICRYCLTTAIIDPDFTLREPATAEEKEVCANALSDIMKQALKDQN